MRALRAIYNKAIKDEIVDQESYPFGRNKYNIPSGPSKKRSLRKEDILTIEKHSTSENSSLWHTRNMFLFSFYTRGMNWVDMAHLKLANIQNGRIEYIRTKTKRKFAKVFSIRVNEKIKNILDFYCQGKSQEDYIFPIIHRDQNTELIRKDIKYGLKRFNKDLKVIGDRCNIKTSLTSYVARHSWATIAKKSGIDIGIISDALGHQDTIVTREYLESFGSEEIDEANEIIIN